MKRCLVMLGATMFVFLFAEMAVPQPAEACSPPETHRIEFLQDDTPDCIEIWSWTPGEGQPPEVYSSGGFDISNRCNEDLELTAIECEHCDTQLIIEAGTNAFVIVDGRDYAEWVDGEVSEQRYLWAMGDEEGELHTRTTFIDPSGACSGMFGCHATSAGSGGEGAPLFLLALAIGYMVFVRPKRRTSTTSDC